MSPTGHSERVGWPAWARLLFAVPCLLGVWATVKLVRAPDVPVWVTLGTLAATAGILFAGWRLRWVASRFDAAGVAYGFGGLNHRIDRERLESVEPEDYSALRYMGWGYRIGPVHGERAYAVLGCRRGVRVRFRDPTGSPREVFLACRDPEAAAAAATAATKA